MATVISDVLIAGVGGGLTTVDLIAYSQISESDGLGGTELTMTKSLKLKLDELESGAADATKIPYRDGSVSSALDSLLDGDGLDGTIVGQVLSYASAAENAAATVSTLNTLITTNINLGVLSMNDIKSETSTYVDSIKSQVNKIENIASSLASVFDGDSDFLVLSKTLYDALEVKKDSTVYFCFDDDTSAATRYTLTVTSEDSSMGSAYGGGTYAEGTSVTVFAIAKNGFLFVKWNTGSTDNPITIHPMEDKVIIAKFTAIPGSAGADGGQSSGGNSGGTSGGLDSGQSTPGETGSNSAATLGTGLNTDTLFLTNSLYTDSTNTATLVGAMVDEDGVLYFGN